MRHLTTPFLAALTVSLAGCTSDLRAPSNFLLNDDSSAETASGELMVNCDELPLAAVGAAFSFTVDASGGDENYTFVFPDGASVPAGLTIEGSSGEITGIPEAEDGGSFDVMVTDGDGATGTTTCAIDINGQLAVDLDVNPPGCLSGSQSLLDAIVPGTGDGTEIVCAGPGGRGNGRMPDGHSVGADSCEIEGTFQDIRFGTWVVMMRGSQSGVEVWVPYCITNDDPGDFYDVRVAHSGVDDNTLAPMIGTFNPDASFALGMPGDPHFTVVDEDSCGTNSCSFGFNYSVTSNNFNDVELDALVTGDALLRDDMDNPVGMMHDLVRLEGRNIGDGFRDRPWTMSLEFDYCLSATAADCTGGAIQENAGARFHFSVLMFPDA
ncbi:MAG: putative Ig domain-containing protein, partial [Nannocystaceae bacterium]|nr:putative Ig domain-containing protein [Nannocystaceae bacterium]